MRGQSREEEERERKSGRAECREAPNCLLQHVMTSLVYINLSLLRPISVPTQCKADADSGLCADAEREVIG